MNKYVNLPGLVVIILLTSFSWYIPTYAGSSDCVIQNGMSDELSAYIKTVDTLLSRISETEIKNMCDTSGENSASNNANKALSAVVGSMNETIGFSNFSTSGRFYIDIAMKTEIPKSITRDHALLGKEIERIKNTMDMVYSQCSENVVPKSNISGDPVYDTSGKTLGVILKEVLQNQVEMMNFYRETVLGDKTEGSYDFKLVGNSKEFITTFQGNYGPKAFESCNKKSDFFKSIKEAFGRITTLGGGIEKGMNDWEKAMALLNANSTDREYAETERNVLRNELSSQGMSTKGSQTIMNNLAKYNSQDSSEGLSGFVGSIGERVFASANQFEKVYDGIVAMLRKPQTTDKYMETTQILTDLKTDINKDIIKDYELAKSLIGPENQSTDMTVGKLIDTHILIESTNRFIQPYIKVSEQTCDAQDAGNGVCRFR